MTQRYTTSGKDISSVCFYSVYKTYEELPLFLNTAAVAKVLGIAPSSSYELMHEVDFPVLKVGNRMMVPKEKFIQWVEEHTHGDTQ